MSIQILSDSFQEHRTVDSIEVVTRYIMSKNDYYRGWGDLYNSDWTFLYTMYLPYEGDNFGIYYNTTYLDNCVLVDITTESTETSTEDFDNEGIDYSGFDYHKKIIVTYTWSNSGEADTKRKNEASSWKIRFDTTLDSKTVDTFIHHSADEADTTKVKYEWANVYLTNTNPDIVLGEDYNEVNEGDSHGAYNDCTDLALKRKYINEVKESIPQLEHREPHTTATITAYSSVIKGADLAKYIGKVNNADIMYRIYNARELALIEKGKLKGYDSNDWLNANDEGLWMFTDWSMEDLSNGFYEYELTFEYNPIGWNNYVEYTDGSLLTITTNQYEPIDFYTIIFAGMDYALPNDRKER